MSLSLPMILWCPLDIEWDFRKGAQDGQKVGPLPGGRLLLDSSDGGFDHGQVGPFHQGHQGQ